jgi:hypothetical protein
MPAIPPSRHREHYRSGLRPVIRRLFVRSIIEFPD